MAWTDDDGVLHSEAIFPPEEALSAAVLGAILGWVGVPDLERSELRSRALTGLLLLWQEQIYLGENRSNVSAQALIEGRLSDEDLEQDERAIVRDLEPLLRNLVETFEADSKVPLIEAVINAIDIASRWNDFCLDFELLLGHMVARHGGDGRLRESTHEELFISHLDRLGTSKGM
jgi:hypothetical protein